MSDNLAYQDEIWEELVGGKVIAMSPRPAVNHNFIASNIYTIFSAYLRGKHCTPFADGTDLYLTDEDRFVPDGMIVCDPDKIKPNGVYGAPDLVIEVLSHGTARNDRGHKMQVYEKCGVREYWIVSPGDRTVEQYILQDGKFVQNEIYTDYPDYMLKKMTEAERAAVVREFKCSLFDDLDISLEDIFYRTF